MCRRGQCRVTTVQKQGPLPSPGRRYLLKETHESGIRCKPRKIEFGSRNLRFSQERSCSCQRCFPPPPYSLPCCQSYGYKAPLPDTQYYLPAMSLADGRALEHSDQTMTTSLAADPAFLSKPGYVCWTDLKSKTGNSSVRFCVLVILTGISAVVKLE